MSLTAPHFRHFSRWGWALSFAVLVGLGPAGFDAAAAARAIQAGGGGRGGPGAAGGRGGGGQVGPGRGPGQGPVRDNPNASAVGTASISGFVVVDGTGRAVRRARVTLTGTELRGGRSVLTDDAGAFSFTALPAGRFAMMVSKAGFVDMSYGAKRPGRPGTPIQVEDGQKIEKANISVPRGSVITGVVVDDHGEPSAGTQVRALRFVVRTGEKSLQQVGQDQTDDRGIYRIYQLQPGDYMVSAVPPNQNTGDLRQTLASQVNALMQQAQSQGIGAGAGGGVGLVNQAAVAAITGAAGGQLADRLAQLQQQLSQADQEQTVAYAPVYYPGTISASAASTVALGIGEERVGVDFQLQLVPTSRIEGLISMADGSPLPSNVQVALIAGDRAGLPSIPGIGTNMSRATPDGRFSFSNVTPGQYSVQARATIMKAVDPATASAPQPLQAGGFGGGRGLGPGGGGRGGPGFPGNNIAQVLWAATDISIGGQPRSDVSLILRPGMTVTGRVDFQGNSANAPTDLTRIRVTLSARGQQTFEMGAAPPAQVDAAGRFTITGVAPGRYTLSATPPAGNPGGQGAPGTSAAGWSLKSAMADGRDVLDFPVEVGPGQDVSNVLLTFTDRTQELSGTIQDAAGRPTSDFTIVVFPTDSRYWLPLARRVASARPGTDGKFTLRGLPAGEYRLTAVTDVEPGEWYDPAFLTQIATQSIPISLSEGDRKVQDIKLAGGTQ